MPSHISSTVKYLAIYNRLWLAVAAASGETNQTNTRTNRNARKRQLFRVDIIIQMMPTIVSGDSCDVFVLTESQYGHLHTCMAFALFKNSPTPLIDAVRLG